MVRDDSHGVPRDPWYSGTNLRVQHLSDTRLLLSMASLSSRLLLGIDFLTLVIAGPTTPRAQREDTENTDRRLTTFAITDNAEIIDSDHPRYPCGAAGAPIRVIRVLVLRTRFGLFPVHSPLLRECASHKAKLCFLFLWLLRCFTSPGSPHAASRRNQKVKSKNQKHKPKT